MHYPQGPHAHRPPMGSDVCTMCRTVGWPRTETPGNIGVELLLWLLCLQPGNAGKAKPYQVRQVLDVLDRCKLEV